MCRGLRLGDVCSILFCSEEVDQRFSLYLGYNFIADCHTVKR